MLVKPPAGFGSHFESRWRVEQSPAVPDVNEQPLAMGAEQAQIAVCRGQKPVDADMTRVSIELNTPDIHTVEVSADSSATNPPPVRRMWPCGRRTSTSLALSAT